MDKLHVSSTKSRTYIEVEQERGVALHAFLRDHHVRCDPPEPSTTGIDVIELLKGTDTTAVQGLLDGWK